MTVPLGAYAEDYEAGAELARKLTERAEVAEANYNAIESEIIGLIEALGFDTGDGGPMTEDVADRVCKLMTLAQRLVRLDDPTDSGGVEDRRTVTLTDLINQAKAALGKDAAMAEVTMAVELTVFVPVDRDITELGMDAEAEVVRATVTHDFPNVRLGGCRLVD